ncbi:Demethylmenaquinone methyltransferase [Fundidesulfovibrio magnetotacticus]|uniref:Demethylmenaquinone methyltransferase n=1 Tax=Fundidesulfovibrio magnetotacticus TaxID=2730080 RepID=A0A6V8LRH9_9BACT|nr:ubiquinone/menaquinone biosynthesis methyltransferase [Fundidesulfovibrio magnetotacticus]GFK92386.1 Demethylmenaquinone methyltransferase [Fundidesulfovibrio magnetotacticus]
MSGDHGRKVASMFGRIAAWYDFLNHFLSLGLDILWRGRLVERMNLPGAKPCRVLDLAAGTLDVSLEIAGRHPGAFVAAADFCLPMLAKGRTKLERPGRIAPVQADGRALPFRDESFEAASIAFGIRNIIPRAEAYAELFRVLKPGGRLCILEFGSGRQPILGGLYRLYLNRLLPLVGRVFSRDAGAYRYLADTIMAFPDADGLAGELARAGFARVEWEKMALGIVVVHVAVKD